MDAALSGPADRSDRLPVCRDDRRRPVGAGLRRTQRRLLCHFRRPLGTSAGAFLHPPARPGGLQYPRRSGPCGGDVHRGSFPAGSRRQAIRPPAGRPGSAAPGARGGSPAVGERRRGRQGDSSLRGGGRSAGAAPAHFPPARALPPGQGQRGARQSRVREPGARRDLGPGLRGRGECAGAGRPTGRCRPGQCVPGDGPGCRQRRGAGRVRLSHRSGRAGARIARALPHQRPGRTAGHRRAAFHRRGTLLHGDGRPPGHPALSGQPGKRDGGERHGQPGRGRVSAAGQASAPGSGQPGDRAGQHRERQLGAAARQRQAQPDPGVGQQLQPGAIHPVPRLRTGGGGGGLSRRGGRARPPARSWR